MPAVRLRALSEFCADLQAETLLLPLHWFGCVSTSVWSGLQQSADPINAIAVPVGRPAAGPDTGPFESPSADRPSIAVLPFVNLSGDPQQEYFSDGITEDIITELSRFSELSVIARNSTFQFKGKAFDIRHVGRELGVRYVLEGSIRRDGDRVR